MRASVRVIRADAYQTRDLKNEKLLYIVMSTQGDGDPPDDSRSFCEFLHSKRAPMLPGLRYAILGLGDSSYPKYCHIGKLLDERLAELGATRVLTRGDCDVDFATIADPWVEQAVGKARTELPAPGAGEGGLATVSPIRKASAPGYNRERPFAAPVLANQRITGRGAGKTVHHVELSLADSGLEYQPGDSVGVTPKNPPALVAQIIAAARLSAKAEVARDGKTLPLERWLTDELEITRLTRPFLAAHAKAAGTGDLSHLLGDHQLIDVVRLHPAEWTPDEFVASLRRLTPRLYSIASSQKRQPEEVHLTVAVVDYQLFGLDHFGAASAFLASRGDADTVPIYIESNDRFRLPTDASRDVVMIGPGTGVAPFRAFIQERAELAAPGRNWLFFGEQTFRDTFLYQVELQEALKKGTLHRLDLAFSRDQKEKIYVQHRMREKGKELYAWIDGGAAVYVCGDAKRMAPDVHKALVELAMVHGGKTRDSADAWVEELRQQQRYLTDVY